MSRLIRPALLFSVLLGAAAPRLAAAEPDHDHDHRVSAPTHGGDFPTSAPPAAQEEHWKPKRGNDWVAGNYQWKHGEWKWQPGHYAARKNNKRWQDGRWEQKGDHFELVAGAYIEAPKDPEAPPALLEEKQISRPGMTWVKGYWEWNRGSYDWVAGHLQARPHGKRWTDGHWDNAGGKYAWTAGSWSGAPVDPDTAPPAAVEETFKPREGFVWAKGYYKWDAGAYEWTAGHWEREKSGKHWAEGHWDNNGSKWAWTAGGWQ